MSFYLICFSQFTEDILRIAAELWMPPANFQNRIGALYLLYGLYFKQLSEPRCKVSLSRRYSGRFKYYFTVVFRFTFYYCTIFHIDTDYIGNVARCFAVYGRSQTTTTS